MTLEFTLTRNPSPAAVEAREAVLAEPGFGRHFTDHMVSIDWTLEDGWSDARVEPYGPLQIDPASAVLHYGQEIFEGMKAYRRADGSVWTFRPEENAKRMQRSAARLALPELPVELFVEAVRRLVEVDEAWVPAGGENSLYLRPFMIANEVFLGVRAAQTVRFMVIASPAGPYFAGGVKPVSIWLSTEYNRAGKGGTGAAKCGGNYAASLLPTQQAAEHGCAQVLFLDESGSDLEELGGMNVVLVKADGTLATPESDSILDGITRNSLLQLAADAGHAVERRAVTLSEWREGIADGSITEVFACGTAAVLTPIAALKSPTETIGDPDAPAGPVALALRKRLTDIQYGRAEDPHGWMVQMVEAR
ncbi:branched-chain amino acid aminotransferase [Agrococcus sp. Marseille-Q4369]|uniref:branched-chain amino acid aminotransferase n=1 Tax=Agrococcus sp. Marseille-Q4369 TaxID=2810513 RepID=UPI001B8CAB92|nr:branched-chain amino acid aminotransferase [Agrococcus sp. Marseille-Q4369]QUW18688.1 branched-chain amino acid aminotransferase [Agrococcus sp. Marseille-Q4369]